MPTAKTPLDRRAKPRGLGIRDFFVALTAFALLVSAPVRADILTAEAVLSHSDLSVGQPISFSVDFGVTFSSIQTASVDAYWVTDGLGPSEGVTYWNCGDPNLCPGMGGYDQLVGTVFFRSLNFNNPAVNDDFLDGAVSGIITASTTFLNTTVTYDRLVFVIDGTVPEPATVLLLLAGLLGLYLSMLEKLRPRLLKNRWRFRARS